MVAAEVKAWRCLLVSGAGAGTSLKSLGGLMAASHECWPGLPAFSREASWLIVIKIGLFHVAVELGEEGTWNHPATPPEPASLPRISPPAQESRNRDTWSKNRISGAFSIRTCMPSCLSGWARGLKNPRGCWQQPSGRVSPLEASLHPTQQPGWSLGKGFPSYCFLKQGKSFPTPLRGAGGEADKEGSLN